MGNGATETLALSIRRLVDSHRHTVFFTTRELQFEGTSIPGIEEDIERAPESGIATSSSTDSEVEREIHVDDREEDSDYSQEGTEDGSEEDEDDEEEVQGVTVRANRRQSTRQVQDSQEESGNAELEDSDADSDEEDGVRVGGVTHAVGKRKRNAETVTQDGGTDLKVGDTVEVGNMT